MTGPTAKLARLTALATLRANHAKAEAAAAAAPVRRLEARIAELRRQRASRSADPPSPATARAHTAWLRDCDRQLRALTGQLAHARAEWATQIDRARFEEGRRQVLQRMGRQAS